MPLRGAATIAVIGAGPAGLMAAEVLAQAGLRVTVLDRMAAVGRKFLLAGRGGLNLTHSEPLSALLGRYGEVDALLRDAIVAFPPEAVRAWCDGLGQSTFVGSSGRVFPVALKASPLLRAWLQRLNGLGVGFRPRHRWTGWDEDGSLTFADAHATAVTATPDATVLALGGASWPRLGSDGGWVDVLRRAGVAMAPLRPANCGFVAQWSELYRGRFHGEPLKRIALTFGPQTVRGEALVTRAGLEGGAIYALSAMLREAIAADGAADVTIDLRPETATADLFARLAMPRGKQSLSTFLRKTARLSPAAIGLVHEGAAATGIRPSAMSPREMATLIKAVPVRLIGVPPIERAISTAGGIRFDELDARFMLRRMPGVFVAGEMLDWEAPTGGYLLQASFSSGVAAGRGVLDWLHARMGGHDSAAPR